MNANQLVLEKERRTMTPKDPSVRKLILEPRNIPEISGPEVSIHIPIYQRGKGIGFDFAKIAIACALMQTYDNINIVLIDDPHSEFDLDAILFELSEMGFECCDRSSIKHMMYPSKRKRVHIHEKRNFAIQHSHGELIANFDDDDYKSAPYLSVVVDWLMSQKVRRGNFWNRHYAYDIRRRCFVKGMVGRCGSGHWVYWRSWLESKGVKYSQHKKSWAASDEEFLRCASRCDAGFSRRMSCDNLNGLGLRFRHGMNTSYLGMRNLVYDAKLEILDRSVDPRLRPLYRQIADKLSSSQKHKGV